MSMTWKKKFAIRDSGLHRINSIFHGAEVYGWTSKQLNDNYLNFVLDQPKSLPKWIKHYWEGVRDLNQHLLYRYKLEFCHIIDGVRVSNWKESPIYYEKLGYSVSQLSNCPNGHYWIKTGKPYFIGD